MSKKYFDMLNELLEKKIKSIPLNYHLNTRAYQMVGNYSKILDDLAEESYAESKSIEIEDNTGVLVFSFDCIVMEIENMYHPIYETTPDLVFIGFSKGAGSCVRATFVYPSLFTKGD